MGTLLNFVPVDTKFGPNAIKAMSEAYRRTLSALPQQALLTRDIIARRIIVRAALGELDPQNLHLRVMDSLKVDYPWRCVTQPDD